MIYDITPVPKPRMTNSRKSQNTASAKRYWAFKDEVRLRRVTLPEAYHVIFYIPMEKSWSNKKRLAMDGMPHQQTPDKDNLEKALLDSIYGEDKHVWDGRVTKLWATRGAIEVFSIEPLETPRRPT